MILIPKGLQSSGKGKYESNYHKRNMQLKGKTQSIMGMIQWVVTQKAMEGIFKEGYLDQGTEG